VIPYPACGCLAAYFALALVLSAMSGLERLANLAENQPKKAGRWFCAGLESRVSSWGSQVGLRGAEVEGCRAGSKGVGKPLGCVLLKSGAKLGQEACLCPGTSYPIKWQLV